MILSFAGDISLHGINPSNALPDAEIINLFKNADIVIGNLENPVTTSAEEQDLLPVSLKSGESSIDLLKYFNVLNLGNNHIFDFGLQGYRDTEFFLKKHKIKYFGAGQNFREANDPLKIETAEQRKIAFISGTFRTNATKDQFGTAGFKKHSSAIKRLKEEGFFIIYYPHWGIEYILTPPPDVRNHAKKMIDHGVDLIIGTHPHVLQGYEEYKGKYIFYSLGNFIFSRSINEHMAPEVTHERIRTSAVLSFHLKNSTIEKFDIYPITFSDEKIELVKGLKREEIIKDIHENSKIFKGSGFAYLKKYYSQVPEIVKQNQRIRNEFQNFQKQDLIRKILIFKNVRKQDLLNRMVNLVYKG